MKTIAALLFAFSVSVAAAGSADAQCIESVEACRPHGTFGEPTSQARDGRWPACDYSDVGHQTDRSTCEASRVRVSDDGSRRRRHHGRRHDDVHLQPGDRVVVDAPEPAPVAPPVQRVSTRDSTARRAAADAQTGVVDLANTVGALARGTRDAVTGLGQAITAEADQRRAGDAFGLRLTQDVDAMSRQRDQQLGQQQTQTNVVAQGAQTTASEGVRMDRLHLGLIGSYRLNSSTGTSLMALSLCAGWMHGAGSIVSRLQGCYSPNTNMQTNAPGVGFLQVGGASADVIFFARSRLQLVLGAGGAMAGSDLVGLTWWSLSVRAGLRVMITEPDATSGPRLAGELLTDPGIAVSHGLDAANNDSPLHGAGFNGSVIVGLTLDI